jgi:hypothetical protein
MPDPLAEEAVRTVAAIADRRTLALLYDRVSTYYWLGNERAAFEPLEIALRLLADLPPGRELALVLHSYANRVIDTRPMSEARPYLERLPCRRTSRRRRQDQDSARSVRLRHARRRHRHGHVAARRGGDAGAQTRAGGLSMDIRASANEQRPSHS